MPDQLTFPKLEPFGDWWCEIFTGRMLLLSLNEQCQSTEGISTAYMLHFA